MKIAIVNDVLLIAEALRRIVTNTGEHEVVWIAYSGEQAIQYHAANPPDLILMDLIMPGMDGLETTRLIMRDAPCAILVVTAAPEENVNLVFRALGAGALDVTSTPVISGASVTDAKFLAKIRTIGSLIRADLRASPVIAASGGDADAGASRVDTLVAIGASTGGPVALAAVLGGWTLAPDSTVVVVQHIDEAFTDTFSQWLAGQVKMPVEVIEDGMRLAPGRIMVAKTNDHLRIDALGRLSYSVEPSDYAYRPSVNVFFDCVAQHWRKKAVGVLLTGMGRDGAEGLLAMRRAGQATIAQDQLSSTVYGMPRAAAELDAAAMILPLERIRAALDQKAGDKNAARRNQGK